MANLLVVDDDLDLAQVTAMVFRAQGHSVRVALDGRDGLRCVLEQTPDLVLMDVDMPHLDGPGMAYQLFLHDLGAERIPLVLVSAVANLEEVVARVGTP